MYMSDITSLQARNADPLNWRNSRMDLLWKILLKQNYGLPLEAENMAHYYYPLSMQYVLTILSFYELNEH